MNRATLRIVERADLAGFIEHMPGLIRRAYLLVAVLIGWAFFRVESLGAALKLLRAMIGSGSNAGLQHLELYLDGELSLAPLLAVLGSRP